MSTREALKLRAQARLRAKSPIMSAIKNTAWAKPQNYSIEMFLASISNPFNEIQMTLTESANHSDLCLRKLYTQEEVAIVYARERIKYGDEWNKLADKLAELVGRAVNRVADDFRDATVIDHLISYGPCEECGGKNLWDVRLVKRIVTNLNLNSGKQVSRNMLSLPPAVVANMKWAPTKCMKHFPLALANWLYEQLPEDMVQ